MHLIDGTYFKGDISLPYLMTERKGAGRAQEVVGELRLDEFIDTYETRYLRRLLGWTLYRAFITGMSKPDPEQIWLDMKEALTHSETDKMSPIAYYVYFYISNAGQTKTSMMGEKKDKSTFASNASNNRKMIAAWRYMREGTLDFMRWLKFHWCDYREYSDRSYPVIPQELSSMVNQFGI